MRYLILPLLIISLSASAQDKDPNAEVKAMGLEERYIELICTAAEGKLGTRTDWGYSSVIEFIFRFEKVPPSDFSSKEEAHAFIGKLWDEKYSKCYCNISPSLTGTLDMISVYTENDDWVWAIYNPNGSFRANINHIGYLNHKLGEKGTVLDLLDDRVNRSPSYKVRENPAFKNALLDKMKRIREYGGRRQCELEGACIDKYAFAFDAALNPSTSIARDRYESLLASDPTFRNQFAYLHNLVRLRDSGELEELNPYKIIYDYDPQRFNDYRDGILYISFGGQLGSREQEQKRKQVCEIIKKYQINRFNTDTVYKSKKGECLCD